MSELTMYLWDQFLENLMRRSLFGVLAIIMITVIASSADAVSRADARISKLALKAIDAKKPKHALKLALKLKDPIASKTIMWHIYRNPTFKTPFRKILKFLEQEPAWPQQKKLRIAAEESIPRNISPANVIRYFEKRPPLSTTGKIKYINGLLDAGQNNKAIKLVKSTWVNSSFGIKQEQRFYKAYRRHLSPMDNWARLDQLLWSGKYWPVRRMLWKVNKDLRALAVARMLLRHRRGNVDQVIAKVPKHLKQNVGLIYERLRWRRRKGKIDGAIELLKGLPTIVPYAEKFWNERAYLARKKLQEGHITAAYQITKKHGSKPGISYADGEWMSGWITLCFLKDFKTAKEHFVRLYNSVKYPVSRSRGAYWIARTYEARKDKDQAQKWYRTAAAFPTTYYGQLSISKLFTDNGLKFPRAPKISPEILAEFYNHELTHAIKFMDDIGERKRIKPFLRRLADFKQKPEWKVLAGNLSRKYGRLDQAIWIAKKARQEGILLIDIGYPIIRLPKTPINKDGQVAEHALILSMIRQESLFYVRAKSSAGAQGLLQLMPETAKSVAQKIGISYSKKRLITNPGYNLKLGRHYIEGLLDDFNGSYIMAIAGYNAGPSRVRRWAKMFGDPRRKDVNAINWVEMIPFDETRNYVQRVLENLQVYRARLSEPRVSKTLKGDLNL
jgi:soluble lytic murein transglycosylase